MKSATFTDGPAKGVCLSFERFPLFLRVVRDAGGKWDVLDQPGDTPALDEVVHAYQTDGQPMRGFWDGTDKGGRRTGGALTFLTYQHVPDQPDQETLRDATAWEAWVMSRPEAQGMPLPPREEQPRTPDGRAIHPPGDLVDANPEGKPEYP